MMEPPEQYRFWSVIHASVLALPGVIFAPFLLKEMLSAPEVSTEIQNERLESGRIQQEG
jgi:hypothetical protein